MTARVSESPAFNRERTSRQNPAINHSGDMALRWQEAFIVFIFRHFAFSFVFVSEDSFSIPSAFFTAPCHWRMLASLVKA